MGDPLGLDGPSAMFEEMVMLGLADVQEATLGAADAEDDGN